MAGLQNFISSMSKAKGFARTARYAVRITPPTSLGQLINQNASISSQVTSALTMTQLNKQLGEQVTLHCDSVSMPGHDLQSQSVQHGSAPARDMVQSHDYAGNISASFYLDSHLRERTLFEMWQKMAVNTTTHKANYYDDYIGSMEIFQLDGNNNITYGIRATEVYPTTIGGIEYSYANENQIAKLNIGFAYRQWWNLTADTIADYQGANIFDFNTDKIGKLLLGKVFGL
jgi:hypothetical protein